MQKKVMLVEQRNRNERPGMSTEVDRSSQSVVHRRASKRLKEGSKIVPPICSVCLSDMVRCVAGRETEKEMNRIVKTLLKMFSKHVVLVLADQVK